MSIRLATEGIRLVTIIESSDTQTSERASLHGLAQLHATAQALLSLLVLPGIVFQIFDGFLF